LIWEQINLDLSSFAGQDIAVRFVMETDASVTEDGWYIDDVVLMGNPASGLTLASPTPVSPAEGATIGSPPTLIVAAETKSVADPAFYGFRIYTDQLCTDLVASADDVVSGGAQTSWTAPLLPGGDYWWRAWAGDGAERTPLSQPVGFTVTVVSGVDEVVIGGPRLRVLGSVTGSGSRLELTLPGRTDAKVDIYDARGARIRRLASGSFAGGTRTLVWDGRDHHDQAVASGVYFVRVTAGRDVLTGRLMIVR